MSLAVIVVLRSSSVSYDPYGWLEEANSTAVGAEAADVKYQKGSMN